ncbi:MAG TPA: hypothetical protein VGI70_21315 [Polyangiales bacterium]|jgi:hypothetical protein
MMRALGLRPYRCLDCWHRYWSWPRASAHVEGTEPVQLSAATRSGRPT